MKALDPGSKAPEIVLPLLGGGTFRLSQYMSEGRVLLVFFKISCPVCQYALPFVERLAKRTEGKGLKVVAVSQDDDKSTEIFRKTYGISVATALDEVGKYPASNAYGLTNVPTMFLVSENGKIERTIVSWSKSEFEEIAGFYRDSQNAAIPLFEPGENVADFRAG